MTEKGPLSEKHDREGIDNMEAIGGFGKSKFSEIWGLISLEVTYARMRSTEETAT